MKYLAGTVARRVGPHPACRRALSTTLQLCRSTKGGKKGGKKSRGPNPHAFVKLVNRRKTAHAVAKLSSGAVGDSDGAAKPTEAWHKKLGERAFANHRKPLQTLVFRCLKIVLSQLASSPQFSAAGIGKEKLDAHIASFISAIDHAFAKGEEKFMQRHENPLYFQFKEAFGARDVKGLTRELQYAFQAFVYRDRFSKELDVVLRRLVDFRYPHEWFPATRTMRRTVHLHVGPTNSGKTYNALKALENSKRGVYAGPLRLLAAEVYQRLRAKGRPCALITGEEVRIPDDTDTYFSSCTVEMMPLNMRYDVAVIDEIQMLGDQERGNGWTIALLGVQAKEVHLCGEERTVSLVQALCASVGDRCIVHRYKRLSPLETMDSSVGDNYAKLQKGDAIVSFSRMSLYALKRNIERRTGRRCAIIYGTLPPEVRVQQAALFNDQDNDYDFVVASDAIGMGLNLAIRRVILEAVTKFDGGRQRLLTTSEVKQIGGRAGRYRTAQSPAGDAEAEAEKVGYVTTMDRADLKMVQRAFREKVNDIRVACIDPPAGIVERYASFFPAETPFSFILMRIRATAAVGSRFRVNVSDSVLEVADILQDIPLTVYDRLTFCYVPAMLRAEGAVDVLRALARVVAENSTGDLLSIKEIPLEFLDLKEEDVKGGPHTFLGKLESLHAAINQYVWLSYRYPGTFRSQTLAFHVRSIVEKRLVDALERLDFTDEQLEKKRQKTRLLAHSQMMTMNQMGKGEGKGEAGAGAEVPREPEQGLDAITTGWPEAKGGKGPGPGPGPGPAQEQQQEQEAAA